MLYSSVTNLVNEQAMQFSQQKFQWNLGFSI